MDSSRTYLPWMYSMAKKEIMGELDRLQIPAMKLKELLTSETEKYLNYWYAIQDSEDHVMAMDLMNKLISEHPGK